MFNENEQVQNDLGGFLSDSRISSRNNHHLASQVGDVIDTSGF